MKKMHYFEPTSEKKCTKVEPKQKRNQQTLGAVAYFRTINTPITTHFQRVNSAEELSKASFLMREKLDL